MEDTRKRLQQRYETGEVPWDAELPPPEVQEAVASRPPGRALDLGCGYGRAAIYLAERKWTVDAVDFISLAVDEASRRAAEAQVDVNFYVADVTDLNFLEAEYDLALDVGCGHSLDEEKMKAYRDQLKRLLRSGALFLFFGRVGNGGETEEGPRAMDEEQFRRLFDDGFTIKHYAPGVTQMDDGSGWRSAWYWLIRQ